MKVSYSKIGCFDECPYKYKLRYIDHLKAKFDEKPTNALVLGTAVHTGIEKRSVNEAIESYKSNYSVWGEANELEIKKLETIIPIAIAQIPEGEYEHKLEVPNEFVGYIDLLVPVEDGVYDLYDFKYSNDASRYAKSGQIHIYKYYFERLTGNKIRNLYYALVPKLKDTITESMGFDVIKNKIDTQLVNENIRFEQIEYDPMQVRFFFARKSILEKTVEFEKHYSVRCRWCEFQKYCSTNGKDTSELDENSLKKVKPKYSEVPLF